MIFFIDRIFLLNLSQVLSFSLGTTEPYLTIPCTESKVTSAVWGPLDQYILTGHDDGSISKYCTKVCSSNNSYYFPLIAVCEYNKRSFGK